MLVVFIGLESKEVREPGNLRRGYSRNSRVQVTGFGRKTVKLTKSLLGIVRIIASCF